MFKELFPNYQFIWNEERFDGWLGTITIQPQANQTLFKVNFDYQEDKKDEVEVYIPTKSFSYGFKKEAELFWGMSFNLL